MVADLAHEGEFVSECAEPLDHYFEDLESLAAIGEQGHPFGGGHAVAVVRGVEVVGVDGEGNHVRRREEAHQQGGETHPVEFDPRQAEV